MAVRLEVPVADGVRVVVVVLVLVAEGVKVAVAGLALIVKLLLVALVKPVVLAVSVYMPAEFTLKLLKVATPLTAATVSVPLSVPLLIASATDALLVVTTLL